MIDGRFAGHRVDRQLARERIDARALNVLKSDALGLKPIAGHPQPAGGQRAAVRDEILPVNLLQHVGLEPHQTVILGHRGQHLRVEDRSLVLLDVVVHPVRINDAIPLAEDDVSLHVELGPPTRLLERLTRDAQAGKSSRPDHDSVGLDDHDIALEARDIFNAADNDPHARADR